MEMGVYYVYVRWIYFTDDDDSGDTGGAYDGDNPCGAFTLGDSIYQVVTSDPLEYELNDSPFLDRTNPTDVVDGGPGARPVMKLYGLGFGPTQEGVAAVYAGSLDQYHTDTGRLQSQIRSWSNTRIKFKVNSPGGGSPWTSNWIGKKRGVWVVNVGGEKTRWLRIRVLAP
jgi:hypothetical protein